MKALTDLASGKRLLLGLQMLCSPMVYMMEFSVLTPKKALAVFVRPVFSYLNHNQRVNLDNLWRTWETVFQRTGIGSMRTFSLIY